MKDKLIKIMMGFAAAVILTLPLGFMNQSALAAETGEGNGAAGGAVLEESLQDYDLVVIQEEEVPLASVPEQNYNGAAVWVVALVLCTVLLIAYAGWYSINKNRTMLLLEKFPKAEAEKMCRLIAFLHPIKTARAEKEIENRIASQFVK